MSKTILLRSPSITHSGYGVHSRQIARWLFENAQKLDLDITTELLNWGQTPWITDVEAHDGLIGEIIQASSNVKPFYDISLQLQLPNEFNPLLARFNVGITAGVETDRCNPQWIDCINKMNLLVVPSKFNKDCFENTAKIHNKKLTTPIVVIPESFPDAILKNDLPELDLPLTTNFNFLVFGQLTGNNVENDRKNLFYTFKWFSEVFAGNPNIGVIFKTNASRNTKLDKAIVKNLFNKLMSETKANPIGPKFYLLHGEMPEDSVAALYRHPKIKALVSFTKGESWGLPTLEAAASGLPIITTNWSGHLEYLNLGKFSKVDYVLGPVHESRVDQNIFMKEAQWAFPKETDAKAKLAKFSVSFDTPKQWAMDLKNKIQENFSFAVVSKHYDNLFAMIEKEC